MKVQLAINLGTRDYPSLVQEQEKYTEGATVECASDLANAIVRRGHGVLVKDPEPVVVAKLVAEEPKAEEPKAEVKTDKFTEMRAKK